jgi:hypothetical protein
MGFMHNKGTERRHYCTVFRLKSENEYLLINAWFSDMCVYCHFFVLDISAASDPVLNILKSEFNLILILLTWRIW